MVNKCDIRDKENYLLMVGVVRDDPSFTNGLAMCLIGLCSDFICLLVSGSRLNPLPCNYWILSLAFEIYSSTCSSRRQLPYQIWVLLRSGCEEVGVCESPSTGFVCPFTEYHKKMCRCIVHRSLVIQRLESK